MENMENEKVIIGKIFELEAEEKEAKSKEEENKEIMLEIFNKFYAA